MKIIQKNRVNGRYSKRRLYLCYKNTGKYPVKIIATRTSCGCTILTDIKRNISPGESGEVNGKFVSNGVVGEQERDIYIQTDDVSNEEIKLNLKINITSNVIIAPKILVWYKYKLSRRTNGTYPIFNKKGT